MFGHCRQRGDLTALDRSGSNKHSVPDATRRSQKRQRSEATNLAVGIFREVPTFDDGLYLQPAPSYE